MAPRFALAIRRLVRTPLLAAGFFGLMAGGGAKTANAEPNAAKSAAFPDTSEVPVASPSATPDEYPPPSARRNLLLVGFGSSLAWYGGALIASYSVEDQRMAKDLRIPIAGPWMALSHTGCNGGPECNTLLVVLGAILTSLDGVGQIAGLGLAGEGLFMPTQEPRRRAAARKTLHKDFAWRPTFDAGKNTVGVGVLGVF
ncbi:MAG TPA: hypothetical protein VFK05_00640 [Polyangiaceae bacterium]|nr:hypothetical protein [Polyangiaceae bacterium]